MDLLNGFGQALGLAAIVGALITAAVLVALVFLGQAFFAGKKESGDGGAPRLLRRLLIALLMLAGQIFVLLLFGRLTDAPTDDPDGLGGLGILANATVAIPVGALTIALAQLGSAGWPRGKRVLHGVAALLTGLAALLGVSQIVRFRQYDRLPSPIVELTGSEHGGCARLASGQVACLGTNREGQRGHGYSPDANRPTLVRGLTDATRVYFGNKVACALRKQGPPVCWGGCTALRPRPDCLSPWVLPGGAGATSLAVTSAEIAGMRADGSTFGWPQPLPPELGRVRSLSSHDITFHPTICGIDASGIAVCFEVSDQGTVKSLRVYSQLGEVGAVAQVRPDEVCAVRKDSRLVCLQNQKSLRESPILDAEQLVAMPIEYHFWSCVTRKAAPIACWNGQDPPRGLEALAGAGELPFAFPPHLCKTQGDGVRCAALEPGRSDNRGSLLLYN